MVPHSYSIDPFISRETTKFPEETLFKIEPAIEVDLFMSSACFSSTIIGGAVLRMTGCPPSKESRVISLRELALLKMLNTLNLTLKMSFPSADI